jgi:ADP-dependent NAD(P)H-hydrate dehydratase
MAKRSRTSSASPSPTSDRPTRRVTSLPKLPARERSSHKGDFGRVLVIGGSRGMVGAPALVANAALRSGAGLVTVACPESIQLAVAGLCPCATSIPLPQDARGMIDPRKSAARLESLGLFDSEGLPTVVAAGPGLSTGSAAFNNAWGKLIAAFSQAAGVPVVLDADALNALAAPASRKRRGASGGTPLGNAVLTPHPGEMARLCSMSTADVQGDREHVAIEFARRLSGDATPRDETARTVVVLKGAGTIVTDGRWLYVNKTGNPGMATGGSGDVLTGIIAALIGQGLSRFDASILGVHLHGRAGDIAAGDLGEVSLIATDLIDALRGAFDRNQGVAPASRR